MNVTKYWKEQDYILARAAAGTQVPDGYPGNKLPG